MAITLSDSMRSTHSSVDSYGSLKTCEKTNIIDLKAVFGICKYRDKYVEEGTATVTNTDARFRLAIAGANDEAALISSERGTYVAGFMSECGLGVDVDATQLTGAQTLDFGYFDVDNGYFFRLSAGGVLTLHVRKKGVTVDIEQSQWNGDYGPYTSIDFTRGIVWIISFTYYGVGSILFSVAYSDASGAQINRLLHSYASTSGLSCCNPNLPITVRLGANGTATPFEAFVGGRQFAIQGYFCPKFRVTSTEESVTGVTTGTQTHVVSYLKLATHIMCAMRMFEMDVVATAPVIISILIDTTLVDATYAGSMEPSGCVPGISGLSRDTAATSCSGGLLLYTKLVGSGYTLLQFPNSVQLDDRNMSVTCRAVDTTANVVMVVRLKEYF
jgi:hypothetical protein